MNYFEQPTQFCENMAAQLLKKCGIDCNINNLQNITAVDILTKNNIKIDVQFSNNFARYGDFRLDIVSAFTPKNTSALPNYCYCSNLKFIRNFEKKFNCNVLKTGKILQKNYLDFFFILFYKKEFKFERPDNILIISTTELINYIKIDLQNFFEKIILNNKYNLSDIHGSAFIPINVQDLTSKTNCFFGSINDLINQKTFIQQYLNS